MEYKSDKMMHDKNESSPMEDVSAENSHSKIDKKDILKDCTKSLKDDADTDWKGGKNGAKGTPLEEVDASGEVNMEAYITPEDVIRAGGFGARDDISSFLPVASDSTDFEASIRDARDYEEPQGEVSRPGLGRTGAT